MAKKQPSDVDAWLGRETNHIRKALESASRYFDGNDSLTVNTLEAVYGRESSFGTMLGKRGAAGPAGHFRFEATTAKREKFILGAYDIGEGRIAGAQHLAEKAGEDPQVWTEVEKFLESAGATKDKANETRRYVEKVPIYESEFATKSLADKKIKQKEPRKDKYRCAEGHWVTIDDRPVFICD